MDVKELVERARAIHGNKYDYTNFVYINYKTKSSITCPKHGEFTQSPRDHLRGCGCPKCAIEKNANRCRDTKDAFIDKSIKVHGDKYIYNNVEYINAHTKVCISCPKHDDFWQSPNNHLNGCGCPKCRAENISDMLKGELDDFIERSNIVHNCKYIYTLVNYKTARDYVDIICPIHGVFPQTPDSHLSGHGCPKCAKSVSIPELELRDAIKPIEFVERERTILNGKEIDVYIPSLKIGIEYNGLIWHSEEFGRGKDYHLGKLRKCNEQGIGLIQIFEDEWLNHKDVCVFKLKNILNINNQPLIRSNECECRYIDDKNAVYLFLEQNSIEGKVGFSECVGAFYKGEMVGCVTFTKNKDSFIINRIALDTKYSYDGIEKNMIEYFIFNHSFKELILFIDRRWNANENDNIYTKIGFRLDSYTKPTKWFICNGRKRSLKDKDNKLNAIYDCGKIKYVYCLENQ